MAVFFPGMFNIEQIHRQLTYSIGSVGIALATPG
jgi:hypothetical protein